MATGQIAGYGTPRLETTSKRAADTSVLLTNMVIGRPGSRRAIQAVARTRFLPAAYRKHGQISDDDMLYTLSLFVLKPIRWVTVRMAPPDGSGALCHGDVLEGPRR